MNCNKSKISINKIVLFIGLVFTIFCVLLGIRELLNTVSYEAVASPLLDRNIVQNSKQQWIDSKQVNQSLEVKDKHIIPLVKQSNIEQYPTITVIATGYTAGIESTGKTPEHPEYGITYSGVKVKRDHYSTIAADLDIFPLGTIFYIPGYGYGIVADKGGAIKGNKLDLYYPTVEDVYQEWGKREVEVYIIKRGNGQVTEEEIANLNGGQTIPVGTD